MATLTLEVFAVDADPGVGKGNRMQLKGGKLSTADPIAADILAGQRRRHADLSDAALAKVMNGWSNGYVSIREVPAA